MPLPNYATQAAYNAGNAGLAFLQQYNANRPDQIEILRQSLYDSLTYPSAGQAQLTFFQVPKGQAGAVGLATTAAKTLQDTNMDIAGSLPAPKNFLVQSIELFFFPGGSGTTTYVPITLTQLNSATFTHFIDNVFFFAQSGWLELFIGSKAYLNEAPLLKFPPKNALHVVSQIGVSQSLASNTNAWMNYASLGGKPYIMDPPILLVQTQNFNVTLNWNGSLALPSGFAAKVVCNMNGLLIRNSQ